MNPKAIIPLIAGIGIAGFAGKLGFDYLRKAEAGQVKQTQIWAAAIDIPLGTAIEESMLIAMNFPVNSMPQGAFADKAKLIGRVPRMAAPAGLPVLEAMLSPAGTMPGIIVPPGLRAVAVKVDESSGVDNHLRPGAFVDVIGFFNRRNNKDTIARTIVENVQVAAVGERVSAVTTEDPDAKKSAAQKRPPRAVTLFVKPEQVSVLHLAEQEGKIKLSMRGEEIGDSPSYSDVITHNSDVLGLDDEEPAHATSDMTAGAEPKKSWLDQIMDRFTNKKQPTEPHAVVQAPAPADPMKPAWTMVLVNGGDRRVLGWTSLESIEPMELSPSGGSLFLDAPVGPFAPPGLPPGVRPQPTPNEQPNTDTPTQEPEELE
jgi:pilus assembly protein CpaB